MRRGFLNSIFLGLLLLWVYSYPYQWWVKYGNKGSEESGAVATTVPEKEGPELPDPFWGESLKRTEFNKPSALNPAPENPSLVNDLAGPVLDEIKVCFGEGLLSTLPTTPGDLNSLVMNLQNHLGPVQEDLLLEKKIVIKMKEGSSRTLVYEWISPEEGSDVYWHEMDDEGFPRPIDLPEGSGRDLATFDRLKQQGSPEKTTETRLIQLREGLQLGLEKNDDGIHSLSLKDEGHLAKCRRDPVKSFVCDCLN
jgi:hypothetical protein